MGPGCDAHAVTGRGLHLPSWVEQQPLPDSLTPLLVRPVPDTPARGPSEHPASESGGRLLCSDLRLPCLLGRPLHPRLPRRQEARQAPSCARRYTSRSRRAQRARRWSRQPSAGSHSHWTRAGAAGAAAWGRGRLSHVCGSGASSPWPSRFPGGGAQRPYLSRMGPMCVLGQMVRSSAQACRVA